MTGYQQMNRHKAFNIMAVLLLCALVISCFTVRGCKSKSAITSADDQRAVIISELKSCADLVTTEIKVRRIETLSKTVSGQFRINPGNIFGEDNGTKYAIVPIDLTLYYGFKLDNLEMDDVVIDDGKSEVMVYLPKPELLNSDYSLEKAQRITPDGMEPISTAEIEKWAKGRKDALIKSFPQDKYIPQVVSNARIVFESTLQKLKYKNVVVEIGDQNLKR